jgi:transcriptional regulator with XRE-family HTH domain
MNDLQLGLALRAARIKRRLRQCDLAAQAGVSASLVSRIEHGGLDRAPFREIRGVAAKLGVTLEVIPRSHGGELDRIAGARHAALGESVATWIGGRFGWLVAAEVSFSIYGERGIVDLVAWHEATASLVVIELKTTIVDVDELIGTLDRKRRLARQIAASRGWKARSVSTWLVIAGSRTNRRRVADHRMLLTSGLPLDGRSLVPLFLHPERGPSSGIAFWPNLPGVKVGHPTAALERVVRRRKAAGASKPRSEPATTAGSHATAAGSGDVSRAAHGRICPNSHGGQV